MNKWRNSWLPAVREFSGSLVPTLVYFSTDLAIHVQVPVTTFFFSSQSLEAQSRQLATSLTSSGEGPCQIGAASPNLVSVTVLLFVTGPLWTCTWLASPAFLSTCKTHMPFPFPYSTHLTYSQHPWKPLMSCAKSRVTLGTCSCQILENRKWNSPQCWASVHIFPCEEKLVSFLACRSILYSDKRHHSMVTVILKILNGLWHVAFWKGLLKLQIHYGRLLILLYILFTCPSESSESFPLSKTVTIPQSLLRGFIHQFAR